MYRRPRWPPCRHHPSAFRPLLPFLCRGAVGHVACCERVAAVQASFCPDFHGGHFLEGMRGHFSIHFLRDEELMVGD